MILRTANELSFSPSRLLAGVSNELFLVIVFSLAGLDLSLWLLTTGWLSAASLGL